MRISFESDTVMPYISTAIKCLTNCSTVYLDDIHFDQAQGIVEIYMQRKEIKQFKRPFWLLGRMTIVFGQDHVKSLLRIKQVEKVDIEVDDRLVIDHNSTFTIMEGVWLDNNEVFLGSLEEIEGKTLYRIRVQVKKLDIEYTEAVARI